MSQSVTQIRVSGANRVFPIRLTAVSDPFLRRLISVFHRFFASLSERTILRNSPSIRTKRRAEQGGLGECRVYQP